MARAPTTFPLNTDSTSMVEFFLHTYLDGTGSFKYLGLWAVGILHSTATLSIQGVPAACMGFGSCTVLIFSCPASATLAGQASFFFVTFIGPNPNLRIQCICTNREMDNIAVANAVADWTQFPKHRVPASPSLMGFTSSRRAN